MNEFVSWISNVENIVLVITSAVTIASAIVKLTPTKKDDEFFNKSKPVLMKIIEFISMKPKPKS